MRNFYLSIATLFFVVISLSIGAQIADKNDQTKTNQYYASHPYWIEMMQDHSVNFYEVQKAFNAYFENREQGKGSGWKQFKRWEYYMEQRVYPSGDRIHTSQAWDEMKIFNEQFPTREASRDNSWTPLGPSTSQNITGHWNPGLGRINIVARDPYDTTTLYIGAASGGLWKTVNEGLNWEVLTDDLPVLGVSAIVIDYTDTDVIYMGTGDKDASDTYSVGVLKSTDGGTTWDETGLDWDIYQERTIAKLLIHPDDPDILFAATTSGLYKTVDGGINWYVVQSGDIDDIEFKPDDPDVVYAVTNNFYRSIDGGETFTQISGLPNQYRVQIAVTEANSEYVYFFSSRDGIYRSEDSGLTFTKRSNQPNQGRQDWYDLAFAASHINPEEVHLGEIDTYRSTNGAQSWTQTTEWYWPNNTGYTHCDIHEMVFYGGTLYVGSDGLVSKSTDSGENWSNLSEGICIRQFYRIGGTRSNPNKYLGGSQDNGTSVFTEDEWHEWLGADGMECLVDYTDDNIVYGTTQGGSFNKSITGGYNGNVSIAQPGAGAWVTPFVIHPTDPETLFVGSSEIRKTTNGMQSWATISSLGGGNTNTMAIANSNPDYLYISKGSDIYVTTDGGGSWSSISSGLPNRYITYIAVHPNDEEKVAVSLSGYSDGNKVFESDDAGATWVNYSANLPNLPANCVIYNDDPYDGLYIGMDVGVYYRDKTLDEWESFMMDLPNVIVNEMEIHFASGMIRAGTYGRGLWEAELHPSVPLDIEMKYVVKSGADEVIEFGESVYLDVTLKNNMDQTAEDVNMSIDNISDFVTLVDSDQIFGSIAASDSITVVDAFSFDVSTNVPNNYLIELLTTIVYDSILEGKIKLRGYSPEVVAGEITVDDGDNGRLDPGDEADIKLAIVNTGGATASDLNISISTDDPYATLTNTTSAISELLPTQSEDIQFDILVDEDTPLGHVIVMAVDIVGANGYVNYDTIALTVGLIVEDFETGNFFQYPWEFEGNSSWTIDDQTVYEGLYSARSGEIFEWQQSILKLEFKVLGNGEISFYKKVSCEDDPNGTGYDYLAFFIDDQEQGRWDGEVNWSQETYPIQGGNHTIRWEFFKDGYVSEGEDAAWVDYIVLPPTDVPVDVENLQFEVQNRDVTVFPNPAGNETTILFNMIQKGRVDLDIFNSSGMKIRSLVANVELDEGKHSIKWNGKNDNNSQVPDGIYFYRLKAGQQYTGRIIIMR